MHVDDFMNSVDEENADGLSALAGVGTTRSHSVVFKSCRAVIKVSGEVSHCRVLCMQDRWYSWICHQHEENNVNCQFPKGCWGS